MNYLRTELSADEGSITSKVCMGGGGFVEGESHSERGNNENKYEEINKRERPSGWEEWWKEQQE